jgi:UDP-N-acetylmuramoyl-L-alanyl-D-glutamate--2,6-diaminopimelate ligase
MRDAWACRADESRVIMMKLAQIANRACDLPEAWGDIDIRGLTADSRAVEPGFLFAAILGEANDGGRFIPEALARGAAALLAAPDVRIENPGLPVLRDQNVRRGLALMAARFHPRQPDTVVAVTGTNGKTSVVSFVRQIWERMGLKAASLGTVGLVAPDISEPITHTTPDPVALHAVLAKLAKGGVTHLALEASSHGLKQCRLDGVRFAAGAFTNLSRDHLDYHASVEDYFDAKARLFSDLLLPGASAVVNTDSAEGVRIAKLARQRGLVVLTVGATGKTMKLVQCERKGLAQQLTVQAGREKHEVFLPLVGDFQVSNALVAAGLAVAVGGQMTLALRALEYLKGARGRLELVATSRGGAPVFVDYAHTPDALKHALQALRPYAPGRLVVIFGCGGDRDRGKRPQMGAIAAELADVVFVTDDNPRGEDPAAIRAAIMAACPGGIEVAGRAEAIARAIEGLVDGDVLLVAGKGHETGQIIGHDVVPYSDHEAVAAAIGGSAP